MFLETHSEQNIIISLSQCILFVKEMGWRTDSQWRDYMKCTTKGWQELLLDNPGVILKVFWTCSDYIIMFVVCKIQHVSEALSSVH